MTAEPPASTEFPAPARLDLLSTNGMRYASAETPQQDDQAGDQPIDDLIPLSALRRGNIRRRRRRRRWSEYLERSYCIAVPLRNHQPRCKKTTTQQCRRIGVSGGNRVRDRFSKPDTPRRCLPAGSVDLAVSTPRRAVPAREPGCVRCAWRNCRRPSRSSFR